MIENIITIFGLITFYMSKFRVTSMNLLIHNLKFWIFMNYSNLTTSFGITIVQEAHM